MKIAGMKYIQLVGVLMAVMITTQLQAQNLVSRSNEINVKVLPGNPMSNTGMLPRIQWIYPAFDFTSSKQNRMELRATVSVAAPVSTIRLVIGDSKDPDNILSSKNIPVVEGQHAYDIKLPITIPDGLNYVKIEVTTATGTVVSEKRSLMIGAAAADNTLSLDRRDYALLFATDKYDYWTDLVNPIDDVHAIARELKEKYGFIVEVVENPAIEDVWTKLREYSERKFGEQDQLLVFFAGHGYYDESFGEGFVVAKNSLNNDLSRNSYISHNRLRGVINNISAPHILLMMDVCFGGTLDPVLARKRGAVESQKSINEFLVRKFSARTRKYLTSGGKEYVSDGIPGKHSPFAQQVMEAFQTRGGPDGVLTLAEMQVALEKLVQVPRFGSFGDDESLSDFVFVSRNGN